MLVCTAKITTATPIATPAGRQRLTVLRVISLAAAAAPTTIPTATMALSRVGVLLSVIPSATGTHSTNRKRSVTPAPQNRLVPTREKRVSPSFHKIRQAWKKVPVIAFGFHDCPGRAAVSLGINPFDTTAAA